MKKILLMLVVVLNVKFAFSGDPIYVTFNRAYFVAYPEIDEYYGIHVWKFDKDAMILTFMDTNNINTIKSWNDLDENIKKIVATNGEFIFEIDIRSPWTMDVYFYQNDEKGTYLYAQVFYLDEKPSWFFVPGDGKDSYWNW